MATELKEQIVLPYKYTRELRPYHDTLRWYNIPVYNSTDKTKNGKRISPLDADRFGISEWPLLLGPDNWLDPSENFLNYSLAGGFGALRAAPAIASTLAPGTTGGNFVGQTAGYMATSGVANEGYKAITGSKLGYMDDALDALGVENPVGRFVGYFFDPLGWVNYGKLALNLTKGVELFRSKLLNIRDNRLKLGNNYYKLSYTPLGTLSSGGLGELKGIKLLSTPVWQLKDLPGYLIKSLFKGSPLEKQLSKQGTISLKQLLAYIGRNDIPAIDKELIGRVLLNHTGDTHIDYNLLRLEVLDMIPKYNVIPTNLYAEYGMTRLGFEDIPDYTLNTFTFESPGIRGNDKHYNTNTLGHSRTYTIKDEPDVLHVLESLSDWALNYLGRTLKNAGNLNLDPWYELIRRYQHKIPLMGESIPISESKFRELAHNLGVSEEDINFVAKATSNLNILKYMTKTYLTRQLQENLKYAAQHGQTKMRYPTPETAAKIEGYKKDYMTPEGELLQNEEHNLYLSDQTFDLFRQRLKNIYNKRFELLHNDKYYTYHPKHQTILKKYADFPKEVQKLFGKKTLIRTVKDGKNNTWYEVDVPEDYLNKELLFKNGGSLIERFKNSRRK